MRREHHEHHGHQRKTNTARFDIVFLGICRAVLRCADCSKSQRSLKEQGLVLETSAAMAAFLCR